MTAFSVSRYTLNSIRYFYAIQVTVSLYLGEKVNASRNQHQTWEIPTAGQFKNLLCIMHERNPFLYLYETSSKTFLSKSSSSDLILYENMLIYFLRT